MRTLLPRASWIAAARSSLAVLLVGLASAAMAQVPTVDWKAERAEILAITAPWCRSTPAIRQVTRHWPPTTSRACSRRRASLSYGPDRADIFRRSASYVDRILRGAKAADLPVQLPIKFEMIINAKTAKALGLTVPQFDLAACRRGDPVNGGGSS
jgi:hypothetical protein